MEKPDKMDERERQKPKKRRKSKKKSRDWNQLVIAICAVVAIIVSMFSYMHSNHQSTLAAVSQSEARLMENLGERTDGLEKSLGGRMDRLENKVDAGSKESRELIGALTKDVYQTKGEIIGYLARDQIDGIEDPKD